MEINAFNIVFILIVLYLAVYVPISGYYEVRKLKRQIDQGNYSKRARFFWATAIWAWVPLVPIVLLIPLSGLDLQEIGFKWPHVDSSTLSGWIFYPTIGLFTIIFLYNTYSIILFKVSSEGRARAAKGIPGDFKWLLPSTKEEKKAWTVVSISAGINEEIVYRGYLFYALAIVFPDLSILYILLITTLIFGAAHIYLGKEAIRTVFLGLIFGAAYIVFDSVLPIIALHIVQDLVVRDILPPSEVASDS